VITSHFKSVIPARKKVLMWVEVGVKRIYDEADTVLIEVAGHVERSETNVCLRKQMSRLCTGNGG